jgi:hypothetical protein
LIDLSTDSAMDTPMRQDHQRRMRG